MFSKHLKTLLAAVVSAWLIISLSNADVKASNEPFAKLTASTNLSSAQAISAGQSFKLRCQVEHFHLKNGTFYVQFLSNVHFLIADYFIPAIKSQPEKFNTFLTFADRQTIANVSLLPEHHFPAFEVAITVSPKSASFDALFYCKASHNGTQFARSNKIAISVMATSN